MSDPLSILRHVGFRCVGRWCTESGDPSQLRYELTAQQDAVNVLYTFVSTEGAVLYLGKTAQPLRKRMYGYQRPGPTQKTNARCHRHLIKAMANGAPVEIHVLPDDGSLQYRGYPVNLAAGLEDLLIATIRPIWNKTGT